MTTIKYVDYEGEAGTGDGSSYANRAGSIQSLGSHNMYATGDYEIRVAKGHRTNLGNGKVQKRGWYHYCGYDNCSLSSSNSYWIFSTTKGGTAFRVSNWNGDAGLVTGSYVEIVGNKWYYNSGLGTGFGDGSGNQQMGNLLGLNGLWRVTVTNGYAYLDEYTGMFNKAQNDGWSTCYKADGTQINPIGSTSNYGKFSDVTGAVVEMANALPIKEICSTSSDTNRPNWSQDNSNMTIYDYWDQWQTWSSNTRSCKPPGMDWFEMGSSAATGSTLCHYELPGGAMDLSAYQGITLELTLRNNYNSNIVQPPNSTTNGKLSLNLCTDTAGQTVAHKIPLDFRYFNKSYGRGHMTLDLGTNLNAAIKSVSIIQDHSVGTSFQFGICNVCAFKNSTTQRLDHTYVIGLRTTADPEWWGIKYFDEKHNAIRLITNPDYFNENYDEFGYYGGPHSCKWSAIQNSVPVYAEKTYPFGVYNSDTQYTSSNDSTRTSGNWYIRPDSFGSGTASNPNKISGGWNRSDMSSKVSGDITHFLHPGPAQYPGVRYNDSNSQNGRYIDWEDLSFHRMRLEWYGYNLKLANIYCNLSYSASFLGRYPRGCGIRQQSFRRRGGGTVMSGNDSADRTQRQSVPAADNYYYEWGWCGNDHHSFGYGGNGLTWSIVDVQCMPQYIRFQGDSNMTQDYRDARDDITINMLVSGNSPKSTMQLNFEYCKGFLIKDWHTINNNMQIGNKAFVTIEDMNYERQQDNGVDQFWGSYYAPDNCLQWNSPNIKLLGGTSDSRIYFYEDAKVKGFTYTGTQEHHLTNEKLEVMLADQNGIAGNGKYMRYYWNITPSSTIRHTNSGLAWKLAQTSTSAVPIYEIAKVAVAGSGTVTVKLWVYRTVSGTNTYALLRIPEDDIIGVTKSEMNSTNGAANTWTELTVTATPTSAGIMPVEIELVDNTGSGFFYFDDLTITQS